METDVLPLLNDVACGLFAAWTVPALARIATGRRVLFTDPLKMLALLLVSGRYAFVVVRWLYGSHRELLSQAELIGRGAAYLWSLVTIMAAVLVIRGYKALGR